MMNKKKTSKKIAQEASFILKKQNVSKIKKTLAGSAMAQRDSNKQTSAKVESIASMALASDKYDATTKRLAGTVLSQSNKER